MSGRSWGEVSACPSPWSCPRGGRPLSRSHSHGCGPQSRRAGRPEGPGRLDTLVLQGVPVPLLPEASSEDSGDGAGILTRRQRPRGLRQAGSLCPAARGRTSSHALPLGPLPATRLPWRGPHSLVPSGPFLAPQHSCGLGPCELHREAPFSRRGTGAVLQGVPQVTPPRESTPPHAPHRAHACTHAAHAPTAHTELVQLCHCEPCPSVSGGGRTDGATPRHQVLP